MQALRKNHNVPESYLTAITKGHMVLHAPGRCITLGKSFLEKHEIERGWVDKQEVLDKIFTIPKLEQQWTSTDACELSVLQDLVQSADNNARPGLYVAETEWCTLEPGLPVDLKYNIRCV